MSEPQDITRSPNLLVTLLSWAEAGAVVEPSSGRKATGWLPGDLATKEELNWLNLEPYRWLRALFSRYLDASELLSSSWFVNKGTGVWSDDAVGVLQGFLSDAPAGTESLVTDLWLDPNDTGAVRVQVNVPKAGPAQFLANRDTYVFVPIDVVGPPTVSEPELALVDVPVGDPAPATGAGFVLVWRVETDGAGIVDQEIFLPDFPALKKVSFEELIVAVLTVAGNLDVGGDLDVAGNTTLGDDPADTTTITGPTTIKGSAVITTVPTLTVGLNVTGAGDAWAVEVDGLGDIAIAAQNASANPTIVGTNLGTGQGVFAGATDASTCGLKAENNAGCAVDAVGAGSAPALKAEAIGTGSGATVTNDDATSPAMVVTNSNAAGPGLDMQSDIIVATGKEVTLTGTAQVLGGLSAKMTAGTFDTIDETGVVNAGGLDLYTDASPGAASGLVQWNGKRLSVGDGGALQVIRAPYFDYVATESTTAAATDIVGLNITANVPPTQDIYITLDAHQFVDAVEGGLLRIRATNGADSVTQLNLGDDDAAVSQLPNAAIANQRRPNSVRVRWRPTNDFAVPASDTWTFFAVHGVSGLNNLKTTAATLMIQFL